MQKYLKIVLKMPVALYRKVREGKNKELTEKEIADIDKECEIIRNREVITKDLQHKPDRNY